MRKPQAKNAGPQKISRCFAKRVSGEQRDLRAVSAKLRMEQNSRKSVCKRVKSGAQNVPRRRVYPQGFRAGASGASDGTENEPTCI